MTVSDASKETKDELANNLYNVSDLYTVDISLKTDTNPDETLLQFSVNTALLPDFERLISPGYSFEIEKSTFYASKTKLYNEKDLSVGALAGEYDLNGTIVFRDTSVFFYTYSLYSSAFLQFDNLEYVFPESLYLRPINLSLSEINDSFIYQTSENAQGGYLCFDRSIFEVKSVAECKRYSIPASFSSRSMTDFLLKNSYAVDPFKFPVNAFLLSSFASTLMLYASLVGIYTLKGMSSLSNRFSRKYTNYVNQAPYTIAGFGLGVGFYVLSGLIDIVWPFVF